MELDVKLMENKDEQFDLSDWPCVELSNRKKLKTILLDYNSHTVVATLHVNPNVKNKMAWQRFLPTADLEYFYSQLDEPVDFQKKFEWKKDVQSKSSNNHKEEFTPLVLGVTKNIHKMEAYIS
ncbi:hypothetical protein C1645_832927 [Glomus cerebriforme]|uniref:Uncharacterized protein n=1 Tax=Glomus cerebriforme TaxID=658196 RepID=A0A397SJ53_9GLOM|nr:hypothetical protein C1645_832927 [Glomus cerebriforme]